MGQSNEGSGETPRASMEGDYEFGRAEPTSPPKITEEEASRAAPIMDEAKAIESFTVLTRSSDGRETRTAPGEALREAITTELNAPAKGADSDSLPSVPAGEDPSFGEERQVFGADDRVQITNTKTYPFTAIGYIEGKVKENWSTCSGTLIGPRTVLTAAHCLYNHEAAAFLEEVVYIPGFNGPQDAPFGVYKAESLSIVEGYTKNYQGYYGSVVPWDLGIITLAEPAGDTLGWLGFANLADLGDFSANIVGYPGDKPGGTMWRATCNVIAENIGGDIFEYDCDTYPGSSGSSVYFYDNATKQRVVTGVNVAENQVANTAVRLNATYVEWINSLWK